MKNIVKVSIFSTLLLLTGCGGGGGGEEITPPTTETQQEPQTEATQEETQPLSIEMEKGYKYYIHEGDKIKKNAPDTVIKVENSLEDGTTKATLEQGSATLIYAQ
jgi:hypothetical protein